VRALALPGKVALRFRSAQAQRPQQRNDTFSLTILSFIFIYNKKFLTEKVNILRTGRKVLTFGVEMGSNLETTNHGLVKGQRP